MRLHALNVAKEVQLLAFQRLKPFLEETEANLELGQPIRGILGHPPRLEQALTAAYAEIA